MRSETFVDNETLVVTGESFGQPETSAALQWSLKRTINDRAPTINVVSNGADASIIAFDLRVDLLSDPTVADITRGMEIELASYQPLSGQAPKLRSEVTRQLLEQIIDFAYQPPKSKY